MSLNNLLSRKEVSNIPIFVIMIISVIFFFGFWKPGATTNRRIDQRRNDQSVVNIAHSLTSSTEFLRGVLCQRIRSYPENFPSKINKKLVVRFRHLEPCFTKKLKYNKYELSSLQTALVNRHTLVNQPAGVPPENQKIDTNRKRQLPALSESRLFYIGVYNFSNARELILQYKYHV